MKREPQGKGLFLRLLCWLFPKNEWPIRKRYMMAEEGLTHDGCLLCDSLDICEVHAVRGDSYVGEYLLGIMVSDVRFPKSTTRDLNAEEKKKYNGMRVTVGNGWLFTISVNY